jgi:DNA-binding Lrp family transcriptional regulator
MTDLELHILALLQADPRRTNRSLAEAVGAAPSTAFNRVRDLEARKVITGYHARVDLAAIGRALQAMVFVRLHPKNAETVDRFVEHVWALPETVAVHLISGADDALVHLAVKDTNSLRETVLNGISNFPGVVDERTSLVFDHRQKAVIEPLEPLRET